MIPEFMAENYMVAAAATLNFAAPSDVRAVVVSFGGVEHRSEFVGERHQLLQ